MRKLLPCILLLSLLLPGCGSRQPVVREAFLLDTFVSVTLYDGGEAAAQGALDLCHSYEEVFSRTDPNSELSRLNRREISRVSDDLAAVIALGLDCARRTGGAFDITAGSITALWDFSAETPQLPEAAAVAEGLTHVGWEKVALDGNTVTFSDTESPSTVYSIQSVITGSPVTEPESPSKQGYVFDGWYTSDGVKWDFSDLVQQDMTLYARWVHELVYTSAPSSGQILWARA